MEKSEEYWSIVEEIDFIGNILWYLQEKNFEQVEDMLYNLREDLKKSIDYE